MKIVRKTESELVTADSGLFLCWLFTVVGVVLSIVSVQPGRHGMLFGAGFLLLCAMICLRKTTFTFDRARGIAFWRRRKIFAISSGEIPLRDISDIGFDTMIGQHGEMTYRLIVMTASGRVPMADMYGGGQKYYESVRDAIVEFLASCSSTADRTAVGEEGDASSLRALIQQGRKLDAIAMVRSKENLDLAHAKERVDEIDRQLRAER